MITIKHRNGADIYASQDADTIREALEEAVRSGVDLDGADLRGANLGGANLAGADLHEADLTGANLTGADLDGAYLYRANLDGADLHEADLRGADLHEADLHEADLRGADIHEADLRGADLRAAKLDAIRDDLWAVLDLQPQEVPGLLEALRAGRIDGSYYEGECACLVGTIARVAGKPYRRLSVMPMASRPAERWFLALSPGDTPFSSQVAAITEEWIVAWQARREGGVA